MIGAHYMRNLILKFVSITMLFGLLINLSGCAALKKKFTPKKKVTTKTPLYQVRKYDTKPALGLYEKHYIFWVNWHKKLVNELGNNYKSDLRSVREMIESLGDMAILLVDEKAASLAPHIDELARAEAIIKKRNITKVSEVRIRRILEKEYRAVKREFSPSRVADYIRKEWK